MSVDANSRNPNRHAIISGVTPCATVLFTSAATLAASRAASTSASSASVSPPPSAPLPSSAAGTALAGVPAAPLSSSGVDASCRALELCLFSCSADAGARRSGSAAKLPVEAARCIGEAAYSSSMMSPVAHRGTAAR
eukprot:1823247-Prymnesium_polylepis.2